MSFIDDIQKAPSIYCDGSSPFAPNSWKVAMQPTLVVLWTDKHFFEPSRDEEPSILQFFDSWHITV